MFSRLGSRRSTTNLSNIYPKGDRKQDASWDGVWMALGRIVGEFLAQVGTQIGTKLAPKFEKKRVPRRSQKINEKTEPRVVPRNPGKPRPGGAAPLVLPTGGTGGKRESFWTALQALAPEARGR